LNAGVPTTVFFIKLISIVRPTFQAKPPYVFSAQGGGSPELPIAIALVIESASSLARAPHMKPQLTSGNQNSYIAVDDHSKQRRAR
jgi:hypothetical protein